MASAGCFCAIMAIVVFSGNIAGQDAARSKRQTPDTTHLLQQPPFLRLLQNLATNQQLAWTSQGEDIVDNVKNLAGQTGGPLPVMRGAQGAANPDVSADDIAQLVNSVHLTGKDRVEFQLTEGDSDSPAVSMVVETLSAEDLLASERGRQQLSQLNAQLELAGQSLGQSVQMVQGSGQLGASSIEDVHNASAETLLGGLLHMLGGGDLAFLGVVESQSMQAMNQLTQTLDQLPGLKDLLGRFYRFVERLHSSSPSTAKDMQQLLVSVFRSFQAMNGETGPPLTEIDSMLEMALKGLNANLEWLELMVNHLQGTVDHSSFLLTVNSTHCLVRSLKGDLSTDTGAGCLEQLLHALATVDQSEKAFTTLITSLTHLLDHPDMLQSFADLMKMPSLEKAFEMINMMMKALEEARSDVASAVHALGNMLQTLWNNRPLLETLGNILQHPESSQVYENAMQFLKDVGLDNPATQQLLQIVNDTISMFWQKGNAEDAVETIQGILTALKDNRPANRPLSESQQALLDLLHELLQAAKNTISGTHTPTPTLATTAKPVDTSITSDVTTPVNRMTTTATMSSATTRSTVSSSSSAGGHSSQSVSTSRDTTTATTPATRGTSGSPPASTRSPDTRDDNGSSHLTCSALALMIAFIASVLWW